MARTLRTPRKLAGSLLGRLRATPVWLCAELEQLPPLVRDISPLVMREMDVQDEAQIEAWLEIQRQAFPSWHLTRAHYDFLVPSHPLLRVRFVYLLMDGKRPVGTTSGGVLRGNDAIGTGHMAGLLPQFRGDGLGAYMALYRYHRLRDLGLQRCETETTLAHRASIRLHFGLGFRPKPRLDVWNGPDRASRIEREVARIRLASRYARWKDAHA